jgi:hypothetical protein
LILGSIFRADEAATLVGVESPNIKQIAISRGWSHQGHLIKRDAFAVETIQRGETLTLC